jgi:hypothetical protein
MERALVIGVMCATPFSQAHAVDFLPIKDTPQVIVMRGQIEYNDDQKLEALVAQRKAEGLDQTRILLNSTAEISMPPSAWRRRSCTSITLSVSRAATSAIAPASCCSLPGPIVWSPPMRGSAFIRRRTSPPPRRWPKVLASFNTPADVISLMLQTRGDDVSWVRIQDVAIWPNTVIASGGPQQ